MATETIPNKLQKLVRCVCGQVFDGAVEKKCPGCGKEFLDSKIKKMPKGVSKGATAKTGTQSQAQAPIPAWKFAAAAAVFLFAVFLIRLIGGLFHHEDPTQTMSLTPAVVLPGSAGSSRPQTPQGNSKAAAPEVISALDPAIVGAWSNMTNNGGGYQTWLLKIDPKGYYQLTVSGAGANTNQNGTFSALNGHWSMNAQNMNWQDEGNYHFPAANSMVMSGKNGAWTWYRSSPQSGNVTTPAAPKPDEGPQPPKSLQPDWQQQQAEQQRQMQQQQVANTVQQALQGLSNYVRRSSYNTKR